MIPEQIFRAYDIRGVYGVDLDEKIFERIGRALAAYVDGEGKNFVVGKDVRASSQPLGNAFVEGLLSGGVNVEDVGIVTTPLLYFTSAHYKKNGGVMISASHNPPEWNGLKIWLETGFVAMGMGMEDLKDKALKGHFTKAVRGNLQRNIHAILDYEDYVAKKIKPKRRLKVAADPGNGSCSLLIPRLFEKVGLDAVAINTEPNGVFPARGPEPTEEALGALKTLVIDEGADFGVGFDGDGDRVVFVDDEGRIVPDGTVLVLLAEHYMKKQKGAPIVFEVSCSMTVDEAIRAHGGKPVLSRVGHTYIVNRMLKESAPFGGETSGHFYFMDVYGFDDALYASLKMAEILADKGLDFSEVVDSVPSYPRIPARNYDCPDEKKFKVVEELSKDFSKMGYKTITLDGIKAVEKQGWFLIRPSNTQPMIRLTVEAKNDEALKRLAQIAEDQIKEKINN